MTTSDALVRVLDALTFAADKHRGQRRKGASAPPYVNHVIEVAHLLARAAGETDVVTLCAAVLHDTVEDTDATVEQLAARFGDEVAGVVGEVTDDKSLPKAERKELQVVHAPHSSARARRIKLADKISNIRELASDPPVGWSGERRGEYLQWSERVVAGLRGIDAELERLFDAALAAARATL